MCPARASTFSLRLRHAVVLVRARLAGVGGDAFHPLTVCSGQRVAGGRTMTVQTVPPVTQPQWRDALGISLPHLSEQSGSTPLLLLLLPSAAAARCAQVAVVVVTPEGRAGVEHDLGCLS